MPNGEATASTPNLLATLASLNGGRLPESGRPCHPEHGCPCVDCQARDDRLEDLAVDRATDWM